MKKQSTIGQRSECAREPKASFDFTRFGEAGEEAERAVDKNSHRYHLFIPINT